METSNGLMPATGELMMNLTAYRAWCSALNVEHWGKFVLPSAEAERGYGAASKDVQ